MSGEEKMAGVWEQVVAIRREGAPRVLACPYCHGRMVEGEENFCCPTMHRALTALLEADEQCERVELAKRIRERQEIGGRK